MSRDVQCFAALLNDPGRLSVSHIHDSQDIAAGGWRKLWKRPGSGDALEFRAASAKLNSQFLRCTKCNRSSMAM